MRVVHIVAHKGINGVTTSCRTLISAQQRHGHEIMLVTMPGGWLTKQDFPKPLEIIESHLKTRPREIARVGYLIRDWNPTVIHCHASKANKYGLVYRVVAGSPVLTTAHARKRQLPFAFLRAVIAPSTQTAQFHRRNNLVPAAKIAVIPHPISDVISSGTARAKCREELGLSEDEFVIGMVGAVDKRKNQIDGLRILEKVLSRHPHARLVVVGNRGGEGTMPGWAELLARPSVRDSVILTGHRDDAVSLIESFDTLLSTSRIEEGPIVVLEAMALERPIVSYAVGMVPDFVRDGTDGFVLSVDDVGGAAERICQLIEDPDLRERIGKQGRLRLLQECGERKIIEQIDAVYERVARAAGTWK